MRVVVPYASMGVAPIIDLVLRGNCRVAPEYFRCADELDYWGYLLDWWTAGGFVVVEHDVLPSPGALEKMWECPEVWCVTPYLVAGTWLDRGLGCTKFSDALVEKESTLMMEIENRSWLTLDGQIADKLIERGYRPHLHQPPALHLHAAQVFSGGRSYVEPTSEHGCQYCRESASFVVCGGYVCEMHVATLVRAALGNVDSVKVDRI